MSNKILKNPYRDRQSFTRRIIAVIILTIILSLALVIRLAYLQITEHHKYATLSHQNQFAIIPVPPKRGLIYDRNGIIIAKNFPSFSLDIIPEHTKKLDATIANLKNIIVINDDDVKQFKKSLRHHRRFEPVPIKFKLTEQEVAKFYVNRYRLPGVIITARLMRQYPTSVQLAHVLGFVGRINNRDYDHLDKTNYSGTNYIGKTGIEKKYEPILHGQVGYKQIEIDASGRSVRSIKYSPARSGENIYLTLDTKLQEVAVKALRSEHGAVVAIDPKTGEILAMASMPAYDPNQFVTGINHKDFNALQNEEGKPLYNRATIGQYAMASTVKPFIALQGLDLDLITPHFLIHDKGYFKLPTAKHIYHDWNSRGHGDVNVTKAIVISCDTFFYHLAYRLGMSRISDILERFGFGQSTGVDLPGERAGLVPNPHWKHTHLHQPWYTGDTILSGIGQGYMLATPLQLAVATATLANRGTRTTPRLLLKRVTADGQTIVNRPHVLDPVMLRNNKNWNAIFKAMQKVITAPNGTGGRFGRTPPYTVAGKTGTAQIHIPFRFRSLKDEYRPKKYRNHSLFIAFAPIINPKIAVAVVTEHNPFAPRIARHVIDYYLLHRKHCEEHCKANVSLRSPQDEAKKSSETNT